MYIIPESFLAGHSRLHVREDNAEEIRQALIDAGLDVFYDFVRFARRWSDQGGYVTCGHENDSDAPSGRRVHLHGRDSDGPDVFQLEDWFKTDVDVDDFLTLL